MPAYITLYEIMAAFDALTGTLGIPDAEGAPPDGEASEDVPDPDAVLTHEDISDIVGDIKKSLQALVHDVHQPIAASILQMTSAADSAPALAGMFAQVQSALGTAQSMLDQNKKSGEVTDVDLGRLFRLFAGEFKPSARSKGLAMRYIPTGAVTRSDVRALERILRNLLTNAVNYARTDHPRSRVVIGCRRKGPFAEIVVLNTGEGLTRQQIDQIREPYTRLRPDAAPGQGIGLQNVTSLAETLGYRFSITPDLQNGAIFTLRVPARWPSSSASTDTEVRDE